LAGIGVKVAQFKKYYDMISFVAIDFQENEHEGQ
jgi:hypothetical protein